MKDLVIDVMSQPKHISTGQLLYTWNRKHSGRFIYTWALLKFCTENGLNREECANSFEEVYRAVQDMPEDWQQDWNKPAIIVDEYANNVGSGQIKRFDFWKAWKNGQMPPIKWPETAHNAI